MNRHEISGMLRPSKNYNKTDSEITKLFSNEA